MRLISKIINKFPKTKHTIKNQIKSYLDKEPYFRNSSVIGTFESKFGESLTLYSGIRDGLKPNWREMFNEKKTDGIPNDSEVYQKILAGDDSLHTMQRYMSAFGGSFINKDILEIGCYDGVRSFLLSALGAKKVIGSDITEYYRLQTKPSNDEVTTKDETNLDKIRSYVLNEVQRRGRNVTCVEFIEDTICDTKIPSESIDVICSWAVMEHVTNPKDAFDSMYKILRKGGFCFHEYNPFFCLMGGHSLCTLDFPWGHARLDNDDFLKYLTIFRKDELEVAMNFFKYSLNRMTIGDLKELALSAGFSRVEIVPFCKESHLALIDDTIYQSSKRLYNNIQLLDLITPRIIVMFQK